MMNPTPLSTEACGLTDGEVVARVLQGQRDLFATIMRRYNRRLFRIVRSIVRQDAEAEDALQEAYLSAFRRLDTFQGRASLSTWLARIAIRAATMRRSKQVRADDLREQLSRENGELTETAPEPERDASARELGATIEAAIDALPVPCRTVVMLRLVEGLSTAEVAEILDLTPSLVRVRLHRGREQLRADLLGRLDAELLDAFAFDGDRCDRMVTGVLARLQDEPSA